jgi:hypothetical protein
VTGKDDLFLAIHERELARIGEQGARIFADGPAWQGLSTQALVDGVVRALGRHFADHEAVLRVFILRAAVDPRARKQGSAAAARLEEQVVALLLLRAADYRHPAATVGAAVRSVYRLAADSLRWRTAFGDDGPTGHSAFDDGDHLDRVAAICSAYLL